MLTRAALPLAHRAAVRSGPFRYDHTSAGWVYARDGSSLTRKLEQEFELLLGSKLDLSEAG